MKIDIIIEKNVPDPRGCRGVRDRLCCRAILPSGLKYNSIEVSIDREKNKVLLTADYIESLKISEYSMCQVKNFDRRRGLETTYQAYLNQKFDGKYKMYGDLPRDVEVENVFVDPNTNLPVTDPVMIGQCDPQAGIDDDGCPAMIAHFFILSVANDSNGTSSVRHRSRTIFQSPTRPVPPAQANPTPPAQQQYAPHAQQYSVPPAPPQHVPSTNFSAQQAAAAAHLAAQQAAAAAANINLPNAVPVAETVNVVPPVSQQNGFFPRPLTPPQEYFFNRNQNGGHNSSASGYRRDVRMEDDDSSSDFLDL